jgi:hypothetical protein
LKDPTINKVLQDMQENPASAQTALADPTVRGSIEKLIAAGILQVIHHPHSRCAFCPIWYIESMMDKMNE